MLQTYLKLKSITSFLFLFNFLQQLNKSKKYIRDTEVKIMFSIMLRSKKHLQMGSIECFLLPILILKGTYAFHQQHFHEAFKLRKITHEKNNNSCGK